MSKDEIRIYTGSEIMWDVDAFMDKGYQPTGERIVEPTDKFVAVEDVEKMLEEAKKQEIQVIFWRKMSKAKDKEIEELKKENEEK